MTRGALCLLVLAACGSGSVVAPATPPVAPAPPAAPIEPGAAPVAGDPLRRPPPDRRGVPHYGAIVTTAVSRDGMVALSRDGHGELRLWPALDGSAAPQVVSIPAVATMRVQAGAAGPLVGLVDESGMGHLLRYRRDGALEAVASFPSTGVAVTALTPLADGAAALIVRADWTVELVGRDGSSRGSLAMRGTRIRAIEAASADEAVALVRAVDREGGGVGFRAIRLRVQGGKLTVASDVALTGAPLERPAVLAVSPDGARAAYFRGVGSPTGTGTAPAPGPRRPSLPPRAATGRVAVVELATGKDVTPPELADLDLADPQQLGFTAADRLYVFAAGGDWTVSLTDGAVLAGKVGRSTGPSTGAGVVVTGFDRFLTTMTTAGDVRYLGYGASYPFAAGLSDDGARVAWLTREGAVVIEPVGGPPAEVVGPTYEGGGSLIRFVGDDHVLVVANRGVAHLLDAHTGAEVAAVPVSGNALQMVFHAGRRWLAGPRPGGGAWVVAVDPTAATPLTSLAVIPDGAVQVAILDVSAGDDRALLTVDGGQQVRIYGARELVAGISLAAIRARPLTRSTRPVHAIDGAGRILTIEGRKIIVRKPIEPANPPVPDDIAAALPLGFDARTVAVAPDGSFVIVLGQTRSLEAIGLDGQARWSASASTFASLGWSFSADGRRLVVVSADGGTVFDTTTGETVATGCGWRFGTWANPPGGFALGVPPLCR